MKYSEFPDPFDKARKEQGCGEMNDQDDPVLMLLRHKDVRKCAHNWKTFQSGATPGRIVVPSEVHIRQTRQIPFEVDPPQHTAYRALVEDWFRRPLQPWYEQKLGALIQRSLEEALSAEQVELVREFSLPLQSRALTLLLNIPLSEAETWISWGTHVFRSEDNPLDSSKANVLYDYIDQQIARAMAQPGEDLYSHLLAADFQGRKLTTEEIKGVMILTFAGGRDTVINALTNTLAYFAGQPGALQFLRQQPEMIGRATEELVRYFSPLTHMGRVVTEDTQLCGRRVKADSRISLCWASANRDESVFERPNEVILDRKVNPHVAFGFSHHKCLGAPHARQLLKGLMHGLIEQVQSIEILQAEENMEHWGEFDRKVGFRRITARFHSLS
ncbi:MAG: cytochrome P450 [Bacteroidetes bacterium]|nr:MAG: cytochrome P450 [Bacteroidota bacterium]